MPVSFRERRSARRRADAFSRRCDVDVSGGAAAESKRVAASQRGFAPLRRPTTCGGRGTDGGEEHGHHRPHHRRRRSEQRQRQASRPPAFLPNLPMFGPCCLRQFTSRRRGLEGGGGARGLRGEAGRERRRRAGAVKGERVEQSGAERRERSSERASDNLLVCTWGPAPTAVRQCVRPFRDQIISPEIVVSMELFPHDIKYLTILMPLSAQKEEQ